MHRWVAGFVIMLAVSGCGAKNTAPTALPTTRASFKTTLTPEEKLRAVDLTKRSPIVKEVIGETGSTIGKPGLWQTESGETIGAVVPIALVTPLSIAAGSIPVFEARCRVPPLTVLSEFRAENVTQLEVYVDFSEKSVVAISPNGTSTYPPDYRPCPGGGD